MNATRIKVRWAAVLTVAALLTTVGAGCGRQPQVAGDNRKIVVSLATAVSAHNAEWLEANAQLIERKKSAGALSDSEYQSFSAILAQARAGDWKSAEAAVYALREAQEPTAEDLDKLAKRKVGPDHEVHKTEKKLPKRGRVPR